ncbi:MAG: adenylate/guanylate cyclase domain-containing protein [Rhodobacteraceae bacterium]|nr:adenylate/guanylate cyclase domain-containing protein [Paracoccaceae bacterium]|tara:strand:- start:448 stop:1752 length:1305 start_codon:yes stop_codon:yes gene_type:complete
MKLEEFIKRESVLDLSFFNFSNAITAAYFASNELEVLRVNNNFKRFFPVLENVTNVLFTSVLEQLGVESHLIDEFESGLKKDGKVLIPRIELNIEGEEKVYSLLSAVTTNQDFSFLNGIQGQFVDRTIEHKLRAEKEDLLDQKLRDQAIIEEKSMHLENIANRLAKYLSPQVYKSIFTEEEASTTHKRKNLTVFFSDIVNFTDLSDTLEPEKLAQIINNYLSEMTTIALECGGTIDKFIGDAVMVFFGDPESLGEEEDALNCIEMALRMKARVEELREYWVRNGVKGGLDIRVGIATGHCTVGNFGSNQRMDYTALGGPVNISARLESKAPKNEILISDATHNLIKGKVETNYFDEIKLKGFARPIGIHLVKDFKSDNHKNERKTYSHRGKHIDIDVFDVSDIRSAIEELKAVSTKFEDLIQTNTKKADKNKKD